MATAGKACIAVVEAAGSTTEERGATRWLFVIPGGRGSVRAASGVGLPGGSSSRDWARLLSAGIPPSGTAGVAAAASDSRCWRVTAATRLFAASSMGVPGAAAVPPSGAVAVTARGSTAAGMDRVSIGAASSSIGATALGSFGGLMTGGGVGTTDAVSSEVAVPGGAPAIGDASFAAGASTGSCPGPGIATGRSPGLGFPDEEARGTVPAPDERSPSSDSRSRWPSRQSRSKGGGLARSGDRAASDDPLIRAREHPSRAPVDPLTRGMKRPTPEL